MRVHSTCVVSGAEEMCSLGSVLLFSRHSEAHCMHMMGMGQGQYYKFMLL